MKITALSDLPALSSPPFRPHKILSASSLVARREINIADSMSLVSNKLISDEATEEAVSKDLKCLGDILSYTIRWINCGTK